MNIERDMADLWFSLSESEKDATKHETKAGVEISQCKTTNRPYLAQIASDLFGPKNKKCYQKLVQLSQSSPGNMGGSYCGQNMRGGNILATSVLLNYPKVCPLTKKKF